jgi:hypothetical protein
MALTKLTKHVIHGSFIVQMVYQDQSDGSANQTAKHKWGQTLSLTPQYSDSILEINFNGTVRCSLSHDTSPTIISTYIHVNGQEEYISYNAGSPGYVSHSFNHIQQMGTAISMHHRHLPGSTNRQDIEIFVARNNTAGGTTYYYDGFFVAKEISAGVTTGTGGNHIY